MYDIYTGDRLEREQVLEARKLEVQRMLDFQVFVEVDEKQASGHRVWSAGWLDHLKKPGLVRSRLVAKQVRGEKRTDVFAGTPPLSAMRYVISRAASRGRHRCLATYDVSVAFFHAPLHETVFIRPPMNLRKDGIIWLLKKAMYGTQIASAMWQKLVRETLENGGWLPLISTSCVAYNSKEDSLLIFHGDDFLAEGHDSTLDRLDTVLQQFEIKVAPRVGPTGVSSCVFLHRKICWDASGFHYVPDGKHVQSLSKALSLEGCKPAATPSSKDTGKNNPSALEPLDYGDQKLYLSAAGLLQYIALDRPDIGYITKEVRQRVHKADILAMLMVKRASRYLCSIPEVRINYVYQSEPKDISCYTDSDWAGDTVTRLSTTGGAIMNGSHWLESWSVSQKIRALSSAEAEFYAQGSGAVRGLQVKHLAQEAGEPEKGLALFCDNSASRAIMQRIGAGKCRHIEVKWLWLQQASQEKKLHTVAVRTEYNIADIGTKGLYRDRIIQLLRQMGFSVENAPSSMKPLTLAMLAAACAPLAAGSGELQVSVGGSDFQCIMCVPAEGRLNTPSETSTVVHPWLIVACVVVMWELAKAGTKHVLRTAFSSGQPVWLHETMEKSVQTPRLHRRSVLTQSQTRYSRSRSRFIPLPEHSSGASVDELVD